MPRTTAERAAATFVDHNRGMYGMPPGGVVTHQFASLYYARLCELRPVVEKAACDRWGKEVLTRRVKTLDAEPGAPGRPCGWPRQPPRRLGGLQEHAVVFSLCAAGGRWHPVGPQRPGGQLYASTHCTLVGVSL